MRSRTVHRLSKTRYVAGLQCPKMLWWMVHEPDAPELEVDEQLKAVFARGHRVGELARAQVSGGVLIDLPHNEYNRRVAATKKALADGAPAIYEASFVEDGVFVAVDILERRRGGFALVEVKSTLDVKEPHLPDVAVQTHIVRRAGLKVTRAEVMHLNRECCHPDLSNLFVREDVTLLIKPHVEEVPDRAAALISALAGPLPSVSAGPHCKAPYECPFLGRCWPKLPKHHVSTIFRIGATKVAGLVADGIETIHDLPGGFTASGPANRQIRSVQSGQVVVEPGLKDALATLAPPIAFLDFETINPAVPVWPGCHPYDQVPVQFSCHVLKPRGVEHYEWLADGPMDPRDEFAHALIGACAGCNTVLAYNAPFEQRCIEGLAKALSHLRVELKALSGRIRDLLPIVRDHVYQPDFGGSFSLKKVLPALVPGLVYDDLEIQEGSSASAALETLLLDADTLSTVERQALRRDLLRYCERDTLAMVRLHERLTVLAGRRKAARDRSRDSA
jgi:hypothetical protein